MQFKVDLIRDLIKSAGQIGITVKINAYYYESELEYLANNCTNNKDQACLDRSFVISFKTIAVRDCDWDNGGNLFDFAQRSLGVEHVSRIKKSYPEKYERLVAGCN